VLLGWLVRGVISSGWLLYPVFGRLPLPWSVPARVAEEDLGNIKSWSRMWGKPPSEVFGHGFWHWFGPWLETFRASREFLLLIASSALLAWRAAFGGAISSPHRTTVWALAACTLGLVQWFAGAPDLRYGGAMFWLLTAALFAPLIVRTMRDANTRVLVVVMALAYCVWGGAFAFRVNQRKPILWGRPPAPPKPTLVTKSATGFELLYPTSSDQCFDAPLPCTPTSSAAKLRQPGSLGDGFLPFAP
jgi:hypothetical protein